MPTLPSVRGRLDAWHAVGLKSGLANGTITSITMRWKFCNFSEALRVEALLLDTRRDVVYGRHGTRDHYTSIFHSWLGPSNKISSLFAGVDFEHV